MAKRWYIVHTYSGYENKVKTDLEHRIETFGMENQIFDIQIPTEQVTQIKEGGEREVKDSKIFPGYVLVRMEVTDDSWSVVRNTPGVTGFVGLDGKPTPLSRAEYNKIMRRSQKTGPSVVRRTSTNLEIGQTVRVVSGPLADFDGKVSEIMSDSGKIKVMLLIFGRETSVELTLEQVESIT